MVLNSVPNAEGVSSPDWRPAWTAPDFFSWKRNRGKKRRRGELLVPLSTLLQKGGLFMGPPHFLAVTFSLCGYLSCMAVQRYPHRHQGWLLAPPGWGNTSAAELKPGSVLGECRGGYPPSALSFPPLSLQRKRCPVRVGRPRGERKNLPAWPGRRFLQAAGGSCSCFKKRRLRKRERRVTTTKSPAAASR